MSKMNLIPEIRFPEFQNEREWEECSIESIGDVVTGGTPSKEDADYWGGDFVWATAQDFKNKYILNSIQKLTQKGKDKSRVIPKDSVLVTCIASIGLNAINKIECATNQQINSIICKPQNHFEFVYYSISHNGNRLKNLAGRTAVPIISKSVFEKFIIHKPQSPQEQQKIASCLSSLDEVIAAHSQKLDLLKDHKKGLMQNLFPQEGEKVPKYRFKEFENDGELKEDILFNLALDGFSNGVFNDPKKVGSGYKLINVINMYSESPISENNLTLLELNDSEFEKNKVKYGDIFFTRSSLVPEGIAKSNIYLGSSEDITYDGHLIRMRPNKELIYPIYLHYLLKTENVRSQMIAKGKTATMTTIGQSDVASVKTSYSKNPKEQQKIASCLSSLDALITAQAEKIEQLKLHKKGLMQGLFPNIND